MSGSGPGRNECGVSRGPTNARAPFEVDGIEAPCLFGDELPHREVADVERLERVVDDDAISGRSPVAGANRPVDDVEELADRHGGRAFEVRALVSTRVGDHQVIGGSEEGVEEELAVLGARVSVADMGIGEDQVIAASFTHPGERPVVEAEQAHHPVRHRPHGDERADGQVPGPEVGSSGTSPEAVGEERADIAGVEHDRGDGVVDRGLVGQVVEQALQLRTLPGVLRRGCGQGVGGVSDRRGPAVDGLDSHPGR